MTQTGFRAGLHLRFFNDLRAVLHLNAHPRAFVFIKRMAHAETAQAATIVLGYRPRGPGQPDRGKDDDEDCGLEAPRPCPITDVHVWLRNFQTRPLVKTRIRRILLLFRQTRQITVVMQNPLPPFDARTPGLRFC